MPRYKRTSIDSKASQSNQVNPPPLDKEYLAKYFDAIFNSYNGIWICDGEGRVLRFNKASAKMNGITEAQIVGQHVSKMVEMGYVDRSVTLEVMKTRQPMTILQQCLKTNKKLLVTGNPVFDENGNLVLIVSSGRDMTEIDDLAHKLKESEARNERFQQELVKRELKEFADKLIVSRSPGMRQVLSAANQVARFDTNVLITGPSGAGKSLLSYMIYKFSKRKNGPFVRVDCGSIPINLFESEVFGYEKGAFTGAKEAGKLGLFEMAQGGVLFLDEISQLPLELQPKLLRFLEKGEMVRVGSTRVIKLDVRVIAATNVELETEVEKGKFRQDLFYRLNVVPLFVPPLKDRPEDIPFLIRHFVNSFNQRFQTTKSITCEAVEVLTSYHWPGNVRELENLMERLVVMTLEDVIDLKDLPKRLIQPVVIAPRVANKKSLTKAVREFEENLVSVALQEYGTQAKAAKALGVSQATINRKMPKPSA